MRSVSLNKEKLTVVWLSTDKRAAIDMAMLYLRDSLIFRWFAEAELILWGPSVLEASTDENVLEQIKILKSVGVSVYGCLACARLYAVVESLEEKGIPCMPMGEHLSGILKEGNPVMFI